MSKKLTATTKQKRAAKELVENGGNVSKAMVAAGYSPQTAKTPQKLTESKGFQELMNEMGVTDAKLVRVMNDGLDHNDAGTRHKYLETALKVKGYTKTDVPVGTFINVQGDLTNRYGG